MAYLFAFGRVFSFKWIFSPNEFLVWKLSQTVHIRPGEKSPLTIYI